AQERLKVAPKTRRKALRCPDCVQGVRDLPVLKADRVYGLDAQPTLDQDPPIKTTSEHIFGLYGRHSLRRAPGFALFLPGPLPEPLTRFQNLQDELNVFLGRTASTEVCS